MNSSPTPREISEFVAAWHVLRGTNRLPVKSEIYLQPLAPFLTNIMIMQFDGTDMRYRLVGSAVEATSSVEVGTSMLEHYPPAMAELARTMFATAFAHPAGFGAEYCVELETGARVTRHSIYLPMTEAGNAEAFFLCYVHFSQEKKYTPLSHNRIRVRSRNFALRYFRYHNLGWGSPEIDRDLYDRAAGWFTPAQEDPR